MRGHAPFRWLTVSFVVRQGHAGLCEPFDKVANPWLVRYMQQSNLAFDWDGLSKVWKQGSPGK